MAGNELEIAKLVTCSFDYQQESIDPEPLQEDRLSLATCSTRIFNNLGLTNVSR